jgi:hypothetical protein
MRKNYKENSARNYMERKGQVAIYVIVAIVVVAVLLVVFLFPDVRTTITGGEFSPNAYLEGCVEEDLRAGVDLLASQGGYRNPEGFILSEGEKIKYLCYNSGNYETCVVQQPMIKNHFERELASIIVPKANECARALKSEYESQGYSVSASSVDSQVSLIPGKVRVEFLAPMTITKENSQTFKDFNVQVNSEMYDLLMTAQSIIEFESEFGDSETSLYLQYYPDLKIEKNKFQDGSTIYKLGDVNTEEEFVFASRSLVWPAGYGLE